MLENWIREARRIKLHITSGREASQALRDLCREKNRRGRKEWRLLNRIDIALDDAEHHSRWFIDGMERHADQAPAEGAEIFSQVRQMAEGAERLAASLVAEAPPALAPEAADLYRQAVHLANAAAILDSQGYHLLQKIAQQERAVDPRRTFSAAERELIYDAAGGQCQGCGGALGDDWHADHVHPHSRGGPTHLSNAAALCAPCNLSKGARVRKEADD